MSWDLSERVSRSAVYPQEARAGPESSEPCSVVSSVICPPPNLAWSIFSLAPGLPWVGGRTPHSGALIVWGQNCKFERGPQEVEFIEAKC